MNFDGPVRVAENVGTGMAAVTLSFDAWSAGKVSPTTHLVPVSPAGAVAHTEPVAPNLVASLAHPDRKANLAMVEFSSDGSRLFTAGYPSGIVQIWDVASRKEVRRIDTPRGYRGTSQYALLSNDWKTLYVPIERRTAKRVERDGKRFLQFSYTGAIRVWDLASGEERQPLRPTAGTAPMIAQFAPGTRLLTCVERPGYLSSQTQPKDVTVVWDVDTGKKWKLCDGYANPTFHPNGKTGVAETFDRASKKSTVRVLDLATGKEPATLDCPETKRYFSVGHVSPDGSVVAVFLTGKKEAPLEVWFRDAQTLEDRGKLVAKGDPERGGGSASVFTPDGKWFLIMDGDHQILVWDVSGRKLARVLPSGASRACSRMAVSPDGKTLAIAWAPRADESVESQNDPDPQDLPQPRVTLIDLTDHTPPRVLVAPHAYLGALKFSPDGKVLALGGAGAVHLFDLTK